MAKTPKMTKMASKDNLHPTVSGSEGSIHINLHKEVLSGFEEGMKVFQGTYYRRVELVQATELDLAVAQEQVKALETKIELVNLKLQVAVTDSERWKRKYNEMMDPKYGSFDSRRNSSPKSDKIAPPPAKRSAVTKRSSAPQTASDEWLQPLPLRKYYI
jgi:hypothetical protein